MKILQTIADGLQNVVANLGTTRDKAASTGYVDAFLSSNELLSMYRNSWLARAIVDYPSEDSTRKWRKWRAKADQITLIENLEKTLQVKQRVQDALVAARLYGGAAIYINTADSQQDQPLKPGAEVRSLVILSRNHLTADKIVRDINSEYYGGPEYFTLTTGDNAAPARIHISRLVIFRGTSLPDDLSMSDANRFWGDSVLQSTMDAIKQMDSTMANIASLVFEAKVDVFKFNGYAAMLSDEANDAAVTRRLSGQAAMKGINGAVVIDAEDDYQQKSASFASLPDVVGKFQDGVSGAAGIPVTRLYGRAAVGLSGSGDGDERVYFDRIGHDQATVMQPAMALMDECIIHQALGSRPADIYFEWAPLRQMTEAERAEIFAKTATAARSIGGTNAGELIPLDALSDALVNEFTEMGVLPGLDQAIKKYGSLSEQQSLVETVEEETTEADPTDAIVDTAPRSLYVSRKVLNAQEILEHYKAQGIENLVAVGDMHVTIIYSREPVDWMKMGASWNGELTIVAGGPRIMDLFGPDKNTVVLTFVSGELNYRHEDMVSNGASWDWPEYQPHISISFDFDGDIEAVEPWTGEIKFGPEIFKEIDEDWKAKVSK